MLITFWGARGSIPAPGIDKHRYGGHTTCVEIRLSSGELVIIDAGTGIRDLSDLVMSDPAISKITFFLTHAHWDHIFGFPFFDPCYSSRFSIDLYGCPIADGTLEAMISNIWAHPYFPVPFTGLRARLNFLAAECFPRTEIGNAVIESIHLNHPNGGFGYRITDGSKRFVFLTDNELAHGHYSGFKRSDYVTFSEGADLLVHDAQFDDTEYLRTRGWGHSRFQDAVALAADASVSSLGLFHHDYAHTDEQLDAYVLRCRESIAGRGSSIDCFGVENRMKIQL
jgi:phosphoribosyl 1,2-cyclic phosphodiesterase